MHRDRIAFVRIVSGKFERGMTVTVPRISRTFKLTQTTQFLADDREIVDEAVAGDIIGLHDTGNYQIGDTVIGGKSNFLFDALPQFTPELFVRVTAKNVMKSKHFHKGIFSLCKKERFSITGRFILKKYFLGAVGQLQFEVFEHRMKNEYNVEVHMEHVGSKVARGLKTKATSKNRWQGNVRCL